MNIPDVNPNTPNSKSATSAFNKTTSKRNAPTPAAYRASSSTNAQATAKTRPFKIQAANPTSYGDQSNFKTTTK